MAALSYQPHIPYLIAAYTLSHSRSAPIPIHTTNIFSAKGYLLTIENQANIGTPAPKPLPSHGIRVPRRAIRVFTYAFFLVWRPRPNIFTTKYSHSCSTINGIYHHLDIRTYHYLKFCTVYTYHYLDKYSSSGRLKTSTPTYKIHTYNTQHTKSKHTTYNIQNDVLKRLKEYHWQPILAKTQKKYNTRQNLV